MVKGSSRALYGLLLISPFLITLVVYFVYALIRSIYFSFTDYNLFNQASWVGFSNFFSILQDKLFLIALFNSILFSVIVTFLQTILALGLALVVRGDFFGKNFFRVAFYIPSVLSSASVTLVFIWVYQKNGFLNGIFSSLLSNEKLIYLFVGSLWVVWVASALLNLSRLGKTRLIHPWTILSSLCIALLITWYFSSNALFAPEQKQVSVTWLGTQDYWGPLPRTMWAIVIQNIYTTVPTFMLLFLAGLQGIPRELYEAARIDGAGKWKQFIHITLPQLTSVTFVVVTFGVIGTLQMFDQVALLGGAAPLESKITLAYYVYHYAFPPGGEPHVGMASAAALVLALITLFVVYLQKLMGVREKVNA